MEFNISGRHVEITPAIRDYAQRKSAKLVRYYDRITEISVVIESHDRDFDVEMVIPVEHNDNVVARDRGEDVYACIDEVADKAERQLTDLKEKWRNRKHPI